MLKLTDANGDLDLAELTKIELLAADYIETCTATGNTGCIADDIARAFVTVMPMVRGHFARFPSTTTKKKP